MHFPSPHLLWLIATLFGLLSIGTLVRIAMLKGQCDERTNLHFKSVRSWWILAILLSVALLFGHIGVLILLAVAGILSLKEFIQILGWKSVGNPTICVVFAIVPIYYSLLACGFAEQVRSMAPVAIMILLGAVRAWLGLVEGFVRVTAAMIWSAMLFVYCLSHAYFVMTLSDLQVTWAGNAGWFLYLIVLTETNDIAQAIVGRSIGRTKIAPLTSPNKSLEGFLGGIAVTTVLAILLAPWLTSYMHQSWSTGTILSLVSGLLIATSGFLGDLNKSGIKRDAGIKDSGTMLPGQGGIMDRVDSLTFSAPVFFYLVQFSIQVR
ncbi:MAG: phosphatidate cytidylyltransferase [Planctomycetota bacterium]|nr:phosphatidate cytidylyltransferase [Planctomycetota bacterium]